MTRDELIEKLAVSIAEAEHWPDVWDDSVEYERNLWRTRARATIDVVVEACAEIAYEEGAGRNVVAAIRQLKGEDNG